MPPGGRQAARQPWKPLLGPAEREWALREVAAVADALAQSDAAMPLADATAAQQACLAEGWAGIALLHQYLGEASSDWTRQEQARSLVEAAVDAVARHGMGPSLYGGFTGIGWVVTHLEGRLVDPADDPDEQVDEALKQFVSAPGWWGDFDLVNGLVGMGIYALERRPRPGAVALVEQVVERLGERAEETADGVTWWTDPRLLPPEEQARFPHGYCSLGLAHGVPGVIAFLSRACAADVSAGTARPLVEGAVTWLLAQRLAGGDSVFPAVVAPGLEPSVSRSAWCYGDPGVAAALFLAARCLGAPAWERHALGIALRAAQRPPARAGVADAGICHGAAGLGHVFNRLYQATGEPRLKRAATYWLRQALASLTAAGGGTKPLTLPGVLEGAAGTALALLAAATSREPAWDRMLLLSVGVEGSRD